MRPPYQTLFPFRWPAWLPVAVVPGCWSSRQAAGTSPSGSPFHPSFTPGCHAGGVVFPPTPVAVLARLGIAGPPRLDEPWNRSAPRPWYPLGRRGLEEGWGSSPDTPIRDVASESELVLHLSQPHRLWSRRHPRLHMPRVGAEAKRSTAEVARGQAARGIPAVGGGRPARRQEGSAELELRPSGRTARGPAQ